MKLEVSAVAVISAIVFFICLDIRYIIEMPFYSETLAQMARIVFIIGLICIRFLSYPFLRRKIRLSVTFKFICILFLYIGLITFVKKVELHSFLYTMSKPFLISLFYEVVCFFDKVERSSRRYYVLSTWRFLLFILVAIDFITIIVFPDGLYTTDLYSANWFLGYKTERLIYSLPLLVINSFLTQKRGQNIIIEFLVAALCITSMFLSGGTSGFVTLLIIGFLIVLVRYSRRLSIIKSILNFTFNYKFLIPVYGFITLIVVWVQTSPMVLYFIQNILGKDPTLTTRTFIWNRCIKLLSESGYISGCGYQNASYFQTLINNDFATSPHNLVLSLLIICGAIGLSIYSIIIFLSTKSISASSSHINLIPVLGIIGILINGVTSSIMVFSVFGYIYSLILSNETYFEHKKNKKVFVLTYI